MPSITEPLPHPVLEKAINLINVGMVVVDGDWNVRYWNAFMVKHSGRAADQVVGRNLFATFPELPRPWLERKLRSVLLIRNYAFTSWQERPYLFRLNNTRTITGNIDFMYQDCSFIPLEGEDGKAEYVLITIVDMTDVYVYENKLGEVAETMSALENLSQRDGLTGLYNRRYLDRQLTLELHTAATYGSPLSLAMIDIDHFKRLNDTYGHLAGDEVLQAAGSIIAGCVGAEAVVARYGGEEFTIVLPQADLDEAIGIAERIRYTLASTPILACGQTISITASAGVACLHPADRSPSDLMRRADEALYRAKKGGRNRVARG